MSPFTTVLCQHHTGLGMVTHTLPLSTMAPGLPGQLVSLNPSQHTASRDRHVKGLIS